MTERDNKEFLSDEDEQTIARIFEPLLRYGTIELRQTRDGILVYLVKRKEVTRLSAR